MTLKEISSEYEVNAKLLKQYFQAFANLYGICTLQKAMQIINRQNPEQKLTKEQILGFVDNYVGEWRIVSPDMVYSNVSGTTPMLREIVNKVLVYYNDYDGYDAVRSHQSNKDYYIPAKEELLKYARVEYYEETQYTAAMAQLLDKELHISDWRRKLLEIILNLRLDNYNIQDFIDTLDAEIPGFDIAQNAIDVYTKLHNNTRLMANRGYTPDELSRKYNPQGALPTSISFGPGIQRLIQSGEMNADELMKGFEAMRIPQDLKSSLITETEKAKQSKPGRNDPCPCGSGKKYKKCCGR